MRKAMMVVLVVGMMVVAGAVALGQAVAPAGVFQAFVVDVSQETPVEVSIPVTLGDGSVITATAPLTVSVELRVRVDGPGAASVGASEAEVVVATATPAAAGGALVDAAGVAYVASTPDNIELVQIRAEPDYSDEFGVIGEIKNVGDSPLSEYTQVIVTVYADDGTLLGTGTGYLSIDNVASGETSPFQVISSIPWSDGLTYKVQISE